MRRSERISEVTTSVVLKSSSGAAWHPPPSQDKCSQQNLLMILATSRASESTQSDRLAFMMPAADLWTIKRPKTTVVQSGFSVSFVRIWMDSRSTQSLCRNRKLVTSYWITNVAQVWVISPNYYNLYVLEYSPNNEQMLNFFLLRILLIPDTRSMVYKGHAIRDKIWD